MTKTGGSILLLLAISGVLSSDLVRKETSICKPEGNILDLSHRRLKQIPSCEDLDTSDGNTTTIIDLGNNHITVFEYVPIIKKFLNIYSLYLPNNKIKSLNSSVEILTTKLRILDLGRNMIEHIEEGALNNFKQLQRLYLHDNRIKDLPEDIFLHLDKLILIDMRNNKLPILKYDWFSGLRLLEKLDLYNNDIETLDPESFEWQPSLCELNLSRNKLQIMPPFLKCKMGSKICYVDFTHNPTYCWCRNVIYNNKCNIHSPCGQSFVYSHVPFCKKLEVIIVHSLDGIRCEASGVPPPTGTKIVSENTRNMDMKDTGITTTTHLSKWSCTASNYFGKISASFNFSHYKGLFDTKPLNDTENLKSVLAVALAMISVLNSMLLCSLVTALMYEYSLL